MADSTQFHETYSHDDAEEIGSDRSFGITFTVVFALLALFFYFKGGPSWMPSSVQSQSWYGQAWMGLAGISGGFLLVSLAIPNILHPFNVVWMKFALVLNKIVSPIVMGLVFFTTVTPIAIIMRMLGKDPLRLRLDKSAKSYWIERTPPGPPPESMKNQF